MIGQKCGGISCAQNRKIRRFRVHFLLIATDRNARNSVERALFNFREFGARALI